MGSDSQENSVIEEIFNSFIDTISSFVPVPHEGDGGGFTNQFHLNDTCMVLIVVYILLFMYKKEVIAMVNNILK